MAGSKWVRVVTGYGGQVLVLGQEALGTCSPLLSETTWNTGAEILWSRHASKAAYNSLSVI